jgi:hypothetical protein
MDLPYRLGVSSALSVSMSSSTPEKPSGPPGRPLCPRCGQAAYRVERHLSDRLVGAFRGVRRYRCRGFGCGWEGLLRRPGGARQLWAGVVRSPITWVIAFAVSIPLALWLAPYELISWLPSWITQLAPADTVP